MKANNLSLNASKTLTLIAGLFGRDKADICRRIALSHGERAMFEVVAQWMSDTVHLHAFGLKLVCESLALGWDLPQTPYVHELRWQEIAVQLELSVA